MCGRFVQIKTAKELQRRYGTLNLVECEPSFNIAPSTPILTIVWNKDHREMALMKWGLVPSWAKDMAIGNKMINARGETVDEKPSFRAAFKRRRCVIPATGFYEWQKPSKQPYFISPKDDVFSFAGLWEIWQSPDGSELLSCTIITTEASEGIKPIHERMPVILDDEALKIWLSDSEDVTLLKTLLKPYDDTRILAWCVGKAVNSPTNNNAKLMEAV